MKWTAWFVTKRLDIFKTIKIFAMPLAIILASGIFPYFTQRASFTHEEVLQRASLNKDYVSIAVSILTSRDSNSDLKQWATEIINKEAPVPMSKSLFNNLSSGLFNFPTTSPLTVFRGSEGIKIDAQQSPFRTP